MKARQYKWANSLYNNDETVVQNEEQVSDIELVSSKNITQIMQLVEKLIDLTVDDSDRAEKVTQKLLKQADMH
ncbi:MAG: hypothetical protein ACQEWV_07570 [Bacillota bacterium]